jgi:TrpR-related protein YerC/YecD
MNRQTNSHSAILDELFEAILSLEDLDECYNFFSDLFTMQELTTFAQRLQVAKLLYEEHTYEMVRKQFPVSNATITRVSTALHYGKGGYRKVLDGMRQKDAPANED